MEVILFLQLTFQQLDDHLQSSSVNPPLKRHWGNPWHSKTPVVNRTTFLQANHTLHCKGTCCGEKPKTDNRTDKTRLVPLSELIIKRDSQGESKRQHRIKELNYIDKGRKVEFTIDSGAAETVTGENEFPEFPTIKPSGPERETTYVLPDGSLVGNKGEKHVEVTTNEGAKCTVRMQVTNVRKSLMSVSKICDAGHTVIFHKDGGYIEHEATGQLTKFERSGGVYSLSVNLDNQDVR